MQMSPVIAVHLTATLTALVIGPIAMWARLGKTKRAWIHRAIGYGWVSMMIVSAISAIFIRDYGLPNVWGYTPIHLLIPFTAFWLVYAFRALAKKELVKHRKAMMGLYFGACIGAGVFTLLPSRYLGGIVWSYFGLINQKINRGLQLMFYTTSGGARVFIANQNSWYISTNGLQC